MSAALSVSACVVVGSSGVVGVVGVFCSGVVGFFFAVGVDLTADGWVRQ